MEVKILARTRQRKGKLFERLMMIILDTQGYHNFRPRINYTGMEIDIKAVHKIYERPLLCECKAHVKPVGSRSLIDFYGKFTMKRSKNPVMRGIFASLSGFSSNALETYDNDLSPSDKAVFSLFDSAKIFDLLRKSEYWNRTRYSRPK
jgi:Restriction endonuclease